MRATRRSSIGPGGLDPAAPRWPLSSGLLLTAVSMVLAMTALGCGSTDTSSTTASAAATISTIPAVSTSTTSTQASTTTAATTALSGTWSGQYSGVYQGTFTLTWQQTGSNLSGTIKLSSPAVTLGIAGSVAGSAIQFGAVGVATYSGSVSGNSMSGTYQTPTGTGSWSATKSS